MRTVRRFFSSLNPNTRSLALHSLLLSGYGGYRLAFGKHPLLQSAGHRSLMTCLHVYLWIWFVITY